MCFWWWTLYQKIQIVNIILVLVPELLLLNHDFSLGLLSEILSHLRAYMLCMGHTSFCATYWIPTCGRPSGNGKWFGWSMYRNIEHLTYHLKAKTFLKVNLIWGEPMKVYILFLIGNETFIKNLETNYKAEDKETSKHHTTTVNNPRKTSKSYKLSILILSKTKKMLWILYQ